MTGKPPYAIIILYMFSSVTEARAAKQFISEEKMANYLEGLHIANETHHPSGMYCNVCITTNDSPL